MSKSPGGWGWRHESEQRPGRNQPSGWRGLDLHDSSEPRALPALTDVLRQVPAGPLPLLVGVVFVIVVVLVLRGHFAHSSHPTHHATTVSSPTTAHPAAKGPLNWTSIQRPPFNSGSIAQLTVAVDARSGPSLLFPVAAHLPALMRLPALGSMFNSQESTAWEALHLTNHPVVWVPIGTLSLAGHLAPAAQPHMFVQVQHSRQPLDAAPALSLMPTSSPQQGQGATPAPVSTALIVGPVFGTATPTVVPSPVSTPVAPLPIAQPSQVASAPKGAWLPVTGVIPAYLDGPVGTAWLQVSTPAGGSAWVYDDGSPKTLKPEYSYTMPPAHASQATWQPPLSPAGPLLGAFGEALGSSEWPLRAATDVRGSLGQPILAAQDGTVLLVAYSQRWQTTMIVIRHTGIWQGWESAYLNIADDATHPIPVLVGDQVHRGQTIGYLGQSSYAPPYLRFVVMTPDGAPVESQNILTGWP